MAERGQPIILKLGALSPAAEEALIHVSEECGEVIQEATKIIRFGLDNYHPDDTTMTPNKLRLASEVAQLSEVYNEFVKHVIKQEKSNG